MSGKRYPEEFKIEAVKQVVEGVFCRINVKTLTNVLSFFKKGSR